MSSGEAHVQTGPFGTALRASDYTPTGTPVINVRNIGYGDLRPDKLEFVPDNVATRLEKHLLEPEDIVFGRKGAVDRHLLVGESQAGWMQGSDCIRLRLQKSALNARFLSYALLRSSHKAWMLTQCSNKATMASLNQNVISRIPLMLPDRGTQDSIVAILSTYDDLIENNRRRIALLEESARLLFKEWFVHLRFPGHEHVKIVDDVPEGWERRTLGDCAKFQSGGTPSKKKSELWDGDIPWVSSGELTSMRIHQTKLTVSEDAIGAGTRLIPTNTILAVVRGMSLAKEFRLGLAARPVTFNQDLKALTSAPGIAPLFLFHAIEVQRDSIRDRAGDASHGTKKLDTPVLEAIPILVPPKALQDAFLESVTPIHAQWDALHQQAASAEAARDLLLPRLMSGELAA